MASEQGVVGLGQHVWVPDPRLGWARAVVTSCDGDNVSALREGDESPVQLESSNCHLCCNSIVQDMTALTFLHEPGVLWNLQARYQQQDIYTYTGNILIAVNPFEPLPHLYGTDVVEQYRVLPREQLQPHVYATACNAYRNMMRDRTGQAILVTGESGAGKTETAKLIMACLAHLGAHHSSGGLAAQPGTISGVEQKILESNPLLEAFGNAKTLRNNNSSRFGKYVEIFFDQVTGCVTGAAVRTYLLERSRVVAINNPERSFHIFYQLVDGASPAERASCRLPDKPSGFAYLAQSSCFNLPGQSNAAEYQHTRSAMTHIGLSEEQQGAVLRTVAAVLHMGNITFVNGQLPDGHEGALVAPGAAQQALQTAAELLGVDAGELVDALTTRQIQAPDGPIITPLSAQAAADARDSMAKVVYARLFDWLVAAVNIAVDEAHNSDSVAGQRMQQSGGVAPQHLSIGLLDIYGFESFEINDLEQLCINLTNEKLQQHFNTHVFKWEQAEYEREGVDWSYISFRDNADVLELLEGRMGIMDLLDESCRFPRATAEDLAQKYSNSSAVAGSSRFTRLKRPATAFSVEHYAGSVTYSTRNFLDKNRDYVVAEHSALLSRSGQALLREVFAPEGVSDSSSAANGNGNGYANGNGVSGTKSQFQFRSVSSQCRKQLAELMGALTALQPHYVRCVKPNASGSAGAFDAPYSLQQLRCGGVMEAVRISCAGYAYKRPYAAFLEHFWQLCPEPVHTLRRRTAEQRPECARRVGLQASAQQSPCGNGPVALAEALAACSLEELRQAAADVLVAAGLADGHGDMQGGPSPFHVGKTKLFLRSHAAAALERQRVARLQSAAAIIQAHYRRLQAERHYHTMRRAAITIQAHCRGVLARRLAERLRREQAATTIQRGWRGCVQRLRFLRLRRAAVSVQAVWRSILVRRSIEAIRQEKAALMLQTAWRGAVVRREYLGVLRFWRAAVKVQAAWRGYVARQLYLQVLPLHRAALTCQRVWRSHRKGSQLAERLRTAFLQYWLYTRAAVVIQSCWRGKMARRQYARMRLQQRRAALLAKFGGGGALKIGPSPDTSRRQANHHIRTPTGRPRGCYIGGSAVKAASAEHTPMSVDRDVVRCDVAALPDRDSRMRARLADLQDFKVSPLVQYWQRQAGTGILDTHVPVQMNGHSNGRQTRPSPISTPLGYGISSSRPGTADGVRRGLYGPARGSPADSAKMSIDSPSLPGSPPDVGYRQDGRGSHGANGRAGSGGAALYGSDDAMETGSEALSAEHSYGMLLGRMDEQAAADEVARVVGMLAAEPATPMAV